MGAVYAIFGAYYNWSPYITGYRYSELLGKIQFWSFFLGVNLLFLPMHFLGLAGMPRRIPDYPDLYIGWNRICSLGSIITLFSVLLFLFLLFLQYLYKIPSSNPFSLYFFNSLSISHSNPSIEFLLSFPPKFHTYKELPIM